MNRAVIILAAVSIDLFIIHRMKLCNDGCVFSVLTRSDDAPAAVIEVINVVGAVIRCCFEFPHLKSLPFRPNGNEGMQKEPGPKMATGSDNPKKGVENYR